MITLRCVHDDGLDHETCAGCGVDVRHKPFVTSVNSIKNPKTCFGRVCMNCRDDYYKNQKAHEEARSEFSNDF